MTLFENEYLFGNTWIEAIPHPVNSFGVVLHYLSLICHYAGQIEFFVFMLPFVYLCYNRNFGIKLGVALLSTGILNGLAKFFGQSQRPVGLSESVLVAQGSISEQSFGFPSGHSHVSILVWGMIFIHFKNKIIRALSIFFIVFTPFSRVYVGVHYPGDVLGGFTMGFVSLIFLEWFFGKFPDFPFSLKLNFKMVRTLSLSLIAVTLSSILLDTGNFSHPRLKSLEQVVTGAGSFSGFFIGLFYLSVIIPNQSWEKVNSILEFIIRAGIILIGIIILYFLLGKIIKSSTFKDDFLVRYFRYFLLNIYIVFFSPYILSRLGNGKFLNLIDE